MERTGPWVAEAVPGFRPGPVWLRSPASCMRTQGSAEPASGRRAPVGYRFRAPRS